MTPTPIDQRRLRDGAAALTASNELPRTREEAVALLEQISDGILALQSLDNLGEEGNQRAMRDLDELGRRQRVLEEQMKTHAMERGLPRDQRQAMICNETINAARLGLREAIKSVRAFDESLTEGAALSLLMVVADVEGVPYSVFPGYDLDLYDRVRRRFG